MVPTDGLHGCFFILFLFRYMGVSVCRKTMFILCTGAYPMHAEAKPVFCSAFLFFFAGETVFLACEYKFATCEYVF